MSFYIYCEHCGQKLEAEDEHIGCQYSCPSCNNDIFVQQIQNNTETENQRIKTPSEEITNIKKKGSVLIQRLKDYSIDFVKIAILQGKKIKIVIFELEAIFIEIGSHTFHHDEISDDSRVLYNNIKVIVNRIRCLERECSKHTESSMQCGLFNNGIKNIKILYYKLHYWLKLRSLGKISIANINNITCSQQLKKKAINATKELKFINETETYLKRNKSIILKNPLAAVILITLSFSLFSLVDWSDKYDRIKYKIADLTEYTKKNMGLNLSPETSKLLSKAKHGDLSAQFDLAECYMNGSGVDKDINEGFKWLNKSARGGFPMAEVALGIMYIKGEIPSGVVDKQAGLQWITKAAEQGDSRSQSILGVMYLKGLGGLTTDKSIAFHWLSKASKGGDKAASDILASENPTSAQTIDLIESKGVNIDAIETTKGEATNKNYEEIFHKLAEKNKDRGDDYIFACSYMGKKMSSSSDWEKYFYFNDDRLQHLHSIRNAEDLPKYGILHIDIMEHRIPSRFEDPNCQMPEWDEKIDTIDIKVEDVPFLVWCDVKAKEWYDAVKKENISSGITKEIGLSDTGDFTAYYITGQYGYNICSKTTKAPIVKIDEVIHLLPDKIHDAEKMAVHYQKQREEEQSAANKFKEDQQSINSLLK